MNGWELAAESESERAAMARVMGVELEVGREEVEELERVGGAGVLSRSLSSENEDRREDEESDDIDVLGDSS